MADPDDETPPEWPAAVSLPPEMLARFVERIRRCERGYLGGEPLAAAEALSWCAMLRQPVPPWIEPAAIGAFMSSRTKADIQRALNRRRHYARWSVVKELRGVPKDHCPTWEKTWAAAEERLRGTAAAGGEDVMKRSYARVERDLRDGRFARYFILKDKRYRKLDHKYATARKATRGAKAKRRS